ncbi:hypothetical protein N2W52_002056 [Clostridium perfringens]|nr:hypothetical protein [Clostridium perfringens]MDK0983073.1 hypothetical protein [Clostridium perfringens]
MQIISLVVIGCCIYNIITNLKQITLIEEFCSVLEIGTNSKQEELRRFMQETRTRVKKENRGYLFMLHTINILVLIVGMFTLVLWNEASMCFSTRIALGVLVVFTIERFILETKLNNSFATVEDE